MSDASEVSPAGTAHNATTRRLGVKYTGSLFHNIVVLQHISIDMTDLGVRREESTRGHGDGGGGQQQNSTVSK